jgi:biopolymer transport protein ExbD
MALKRRTKIDASFNMSSMTDIVFLLLIFFMVTSTMVHPNALKLLLPQSENQTSATPLTTVSITKDLEYFVETQRIQLSELQGILHAKITDDPVLYISLHVDESVPTSELVKVMNICKENKYKLILATRAR